MISQKRLAFSIISIAGFINYILRKVSNMTCGIVNSVLHFLSISFAETVKTDLRKLLILCCKKQLQPLFIWCDHFVIFFKGLYLTFWKRFHIL